MYKVMTFVEDGFDRIYEYKTVDGAAGFADGFTAGAGNYGAGSVMAVRYPPTPEERDDIVECYDQAQYDRAIEAAEPSSATTEDKT
jgi:hypothetical protein